MLVEGDNAICIRHLNRACFHFRLITDSIITNCIISPIIYQIKINQSPSPLNFCNGMLLYGVLPLLYHAFHARFNISRGDT